MVLSQDIYFVNLQKLGCSNSIHDVFVFCQIVYIGQFAQQWTPLVYLLTPAIVFVSCTQLQILHFISFHFISFIISQDRNNHKHSGKKQLEKNIKYMYMMKRR